MQLNKIMCIVYVFQGCWPEIHVQESQTNYSTDCNNIVTTITQQMQRKEMKFCIIESSRSEVGLLHRVQGSIEATSSVHVLPVVIVMKEWLYISATKSMYI